MTVADPRLEAAKQRVEELRGFFIHLAIYVAVNLGLFVIDAIQGGAWWFFWATIGWGIGLVSHAIALFFTSGGWASRWESRKIEQYVRESDSAGIHPDGTAT